jgi:ABC-2 type transport system permease protein
MVTEKKIKSANNKKRNITSLFILLAIILLLNFIGSSFFQRFDLTSEKRYTLAESTRALLKGIDEEMYVKVYLQGDFNPSFTRLRNETKEMLDEFRAYSDNHIQYEFITPGEDQTPDQATGLERQLYEKGIVPEEVTVRGKDKTTQTRIWPGAIISYRGKETSWQIFKRQDGIRPEENINNSVEELEYSLTNAIRKLQREKKPEVTFITGHGEVDTLHQFRFMQALSEYYSVNRTPILGRLKSLEGSDAIIISQPDSAFNDKDKFIIDQFIMNGGKVLWLIDPLDVNRDSLRTGFTIGFNRPLNIEDMLYKYGVRINPVMVQDLQCAGIAMNTGFQPGQPKVQVFRWPYYPVILPDIDHPIVKNLDHVKLEYAGTIDTITSARGIRKTILLKTSKYTRTQPSPVRVSLGMATMRPKESLFINSYQPVACLLEGEFTSFVENRLPDRLLNDTNFKYLDKGKKTKMIVVADGDIGTNEYFRSSGEIFPLGYDRNTKMTFANQTFLLNCMNYLLDEEGMLQLRAREVKLRLLDVKKINQHRSKWQMINVVTPVAVVIAFALLQFYLRRKRYAAGGKQAA